MKKLFTLLGVILSKILPLVIIGANLLYKDESWNLTFMGSVLAAIVIYFAWLRPMDKKVHIWEIQNEYKFFVVNYKQLKVIIIFGLVWWMWHGLQSDFDTVNTTIQYIFISLTLGWVSTLIGLEV
jgi:hypothetical protein